MNCLNICRYKRKDIPPVLDQSSFDHIFQFPHVARPVIGDKPVDGAGGQYRSLRELKLRGLAIE